VRARVGALAVLAALLSWPAALASADSFTPVRMNIKIAPVARRHAALKVTVAVSADPTVLDGSEGPLRIEVRLSNECGGNFQTSPGITLMNKQLNPQPATGQAYSAKASGSGKPAAYGIQTVCTYIEDATVGRVYANDESIQVTVSKSCTAAGARYDSASRGLKGAERQLRRARGTAAKRRAKRLVAKRKQTLARDRRAGTRACGRGVPL
jgi:hypothetical protein